MVGFLSAPNLNDASARLPQGTIANIKLCAYRDSERASEKTHATIHVQFDNVYLLLGRTARTAFSVPPGLLNGARFSLAKRFRFVPSKSERKYILLSNCFLATTFCACVRGFVRVRAWARIYLTGIHIRIEIIANTSRIRLSARLEN